MSIDPCARSFSRSEAGPAGTPPLISWPRSSQSELKRTLRQVARDRSGASGVWKSAESAAVFFPHGERGVSSGARLWFRKSARAQTAARKPADSVGQGRQSKIYIKQNDSSLK